MLLRADRHVWTGAELLAEASGNHLLASSPAPENPFPPTHTYTYSLTHSLPLFLSSLCPSGRGLLLHDNSRQSSLWQADGLCCIILRILPSLRKRALFQVFQLHKLFALLFWVFGSVGATACLLQTVQLLIQRSWIPHLEVYFGSFFLCL